MLHAIRDDFPESGRMIGMKPAGGDFEGEEAMHYAVMLSETLGEDG